MKLIIGCPIYKRDWILPLWFAALERQSIPLNKVGFIFETSPDDKKTVSILRLWRQYHPEVPLFEIRERNDIPHYNHEDNSRQWTISKYENMVNLRNSLLSRVRELQPEHYFSLDSDIILKNPNTLELLMAHVDNGSDAVSPLMFMTPFDTKYPSVMNWKDQKDFRGYRKDEYPLGTYFKSDIIMAAKMMSKEVYNNVDYEIHSQGEDLGWSKNAALKGYSLYCASYVYAAHIMHENLLPQFQQMGDNRELVTI
jgi:hypothetical protein